MICSANSYRVLILLAMLSFSLNGYTKPDTYFGCKNGFEFESKKKTARCIKQQRLIYRSPLSCNRNVMNQVDTKKRDYSLSIDRQGQKDLCIQLKTAILNQSRKNPKLFPKNRPQMPKIGNLKGVKRVSTFPPLCPKGFKLLIKRGKDSCSKGNPQVVLPPSKRVLQ